MGVGLSLGIELIITRLQDIYLGAKIGFPVNITCSIISAAFLTPPERAMASWRAIAKSFMRYSYSSRHNA